MKKHQISSGESKVPEIDDEAGSDKLIDDLVTTGPDKESKESQLSENSKRIRRHRSSRIDNQHGTARVKIYPITEPSIRSLKANSKNAGQQYSAVASVVSIIASTSVSYCFTGNPTPYMKALFELVLVLGILILVVLACTARRSSKIIADEWAQIEKNTDFQDLT